MKRIFLEDYYRLFSEFVKYYSQAESRCDRLQTFAVLEELIDLEKENLSKTVNDKNKPFFYSRRWEKLQYTNNEITFDYPAMFVMEKSGKLFNPFAKFPTDVAYTIDLIFIDKYDIGQDCEVCSKRTRNEIFLRSEDFMFHFVEYMKDLIILEDGRLINNQVKLLLNIDTPEVTPKNQISNLSSNLNAYNQNVFFARYDRGDLNLYGTTYQLTLPCKIDCSYVYDPNSSEIIKGFDRLCC